MDKNVVLIVDDDENIRELLTIMLKNQNIASLCAKDGIEALEILKKQ
jgi:DNA-binding response OmpR family regulator